MYSLTQRVSLGRATTILKSKFHIILFQICYFRPFRFEIRQDIFLYRNDAEVDPRAYRKIRIYADAIMVEQDRRDRILM